ncbi:helix-turn-helix domain-containing protein [Novosphingobium sp.]|uniref:helix-turn-helix domain-containing protein n=1 Tax=Novosphingobium sp. TaxID=1874826 RepID=UPI00286CA469|nr:helix-turn-helix domain-containing protein [Novosphingobium sp.]
MMKTALEGAVAIHFYRPSPELAPYVSTYYLTEVNLGQGGKVEDWLHPEWANLRFTAQPRLSSALGNAPLQALPETIFTGPTSQSAHFVIEGRARVWGVGLLPAGLARFVAAPASDLADRIVPVAPGGPLAPFVRIGEKVLTGKRDPAGEAARIDGFMLAVLAETRPSEEEARVRQAHAALINDDTTSVADLAAQLGMSSRSLERLSLRAFGFSPKLLLRRQRFLRSLAQFMLDPSLKWIATLDCQYVDQAHFVRDFRRFMGMSPSRYGALEHPVLRAAAQARAASAGAAVQALHRP